MSKYYGELPVVPNELDMNTLKCRMFWIKKREKEKNAEAICWGMIIPLMSFLLGFMVGILYGALTLLTY